MKKLPRVLTELEKRKSEFITVTSHQMRTPLTGIKWYTELLLSEETDPLSQQQRDYLLQVQVSTERMIDLVNDLMNVAKIEKEIHESLRAKTVDLAKILLEVIDTLTTTAEKKTISIVYTPESPSSFRAKADQERIRLVFSNLIKNAILYSKEGSTIIVSLQEEKKSVVISFTDTGIGIPKKQQDQVFERFFRGDNVLTTLPGTGIGLYLSKRIMEKHRGKIWFTSKEKKGSTFFISLPVGR